MDINRIAIFIHTFNANGGIQNRRLQLADCISQRGYEVDIIVPHTNAPYPLSIPNKVHLHSLKARGERERIKMWTTIIPLAKYLKREKPPVLLVGPLMFALTALLAKKIAQSNTRIIISAHSSIASVFQNNMKLTSFVSKLILQYSYSRVHSIIAVSKGLRNEIINLCKIPEDCVKSIYNPIVSENLFKRALDTPEEELFYSDNIPIILSVGRLTPQKDFPTLIKAFSLVFQEIPSKLVIIGEGPERGKCEKLIESLNLQDHVFLYGFRSNPYKYMSRAKVFVLSSIWEGFGNVLVEAMALGTPVISTNCPHGPSEILADGKYGMLVPMKNPAEMARSICYVLRNGGPNGENKVKEYTIEGITDEYLKLLLN